jgi:hypothetical protein
MTQQLEYAARATDRAPWGPIVVRPSRRSVVLLLLTLATAGWVAARHDPWVETAVVSGPRSGANAGPGTTIDVSLGDGVLLVAEDSPGEVVVFDADTGRRVRTFGQETGAGRITIPGVSGPLLSAIGYYLIPHAGTVFERSVRRDTVRLLDPRTGDARAASVGRTPPGRIYDVAPHATGVTVLYAEHRPLARGVTFGLWRPFDPAAQNPVRTFDLPPNTAGRISPDGASVLFWSPVKPEPPKDLTPTEQVNWQVAMESGRWSTQLARLYDANTGDLLVELPFRDPRGTPTFSADGRVLVSLFEPDYQSAYATLAAGTAWGRSLTPTPPPASASPSAAPAIERHDARTGRLLSSAPTPAGVVNVIPFADALTGVMEVATPTRGVFFTRKAYVADLLRPGAAPTGPGGMIPVVPVATPQAPMVTAAFPDGRRMLIAGGLGARGSVFDADARQPLARLNVPGASVGQAMVSTDGNRLALRSGGFVHLFRRAGFDCRESHLGVLGMPHVWLLGGLLTALAFSLRADGRRARSAGTLTPLASTVALAMLVCALPRTFHALLAALTGDPVLTPAPLLLVAAIGLATGSRFWRVGAIAVLAGVASVSFYCLRWARGPGFLPAAFEVVDRTYAISRHVVFGTFLIGAMLAVAATFPLVRAPRTID